MPFKNGYKIGTMTPRAQELSKLFTGRDATIQLEPKNYTLLPLYEKYADDYYDFEFRKGDVIVNTIPKSGTTWTQEIIWTMVHNPNLDNPEAMTPLNSRSPIIELDFLLGHVPPIPSLVKHFTDTYPDFDQSKGGMGMHVAKMMPSPRVLKLHFALSIMGPSVENANIVYTLRDPRDTCISYYHHCRLFFYDNFTGTFDQFVDAFLEGTVLWGPYWPHVTEIWEKRNQSNVFIACYEKFKRTPVEEFTRLGKFLGKNFTEEQIKKFIHYTSFDEMKKRDQHLLDNDDRPAFMDLALAKNEGGFFRQGTSGGWKKVLSQEQKDKFDVWIKKNCPDMAIMKMITGE